MASETTLRPAEIKDILLREIEAADLHGVLHDRADHFADLGVRLRAGDLFLYPSVDHVTDDPVNEKLFQKGHINSVSSVFQPL